MMPVRRGHVAPKTTLIETIIRKFDTHSKYFGDYGQHPSTSTNVLVAADAVFVAIASKLNGGVGIWVRERVAKGSPSNAWIIMGTICSSGKLPARRGREVGGG